MKKYLLCLGVLTLFLMNSCVVSKKVVYVKDMSIDSTYRTMMAPALRIQKNDRLSIQISSKNPELSVPFNQEGGLFNVTEKGAIAANNGVTNITEKGYLVDQLGNIEFPVFGTLNVEGMTLEELKNSLREKLVSQKLISNPVVKIELINLKIMMMGEFNSKGMLNVPDGRITLLEAITRSGGLSTNAVTNEIAVIREEEGERKMYYNDIEKVDIFNSPTYYLQQNDIVYVKPKGAIPSAREDMTLRYIGLGTSFVTLILTMFAIFKK